LLISSGPSLSAAAMSSTQAMSDAIIDLLKCVLCAAAAAVQHNVCSVHDVPCDEVRGFVVEVYS
jgi:hypothetical protein